MIMRLKEIAGWVIVSAFALLLIVGLVMSIGVFKTLILLALVFVVIKSVMFIAEGEIERDERKRRKGNALPPFKNPPPMPISKMPVANIKFDPKPLIKEEYSSQPIGIVHTKGDKIEFISLNHYGYGNNSFTDTELPY